MHSVLSEQLVGVYLHGSLALGSFNHLKSIAQDSEWSYGNISRGAREGPGPVPIYAVLNFCRVLAFIKRALLFPKKKVASGGLKNLPNEFHPVINESLNEYKQSGTAKLVDLELLQKFADYSIKIIR